MRLLVLSHPSATPINQQFFAVVERVAGWDVTIVAPSRWKDDYGSTRTLERWPEFRGRLVPIPVWFSGNVPLHVYQSFFISHLAEAAPDAIYVHHEPYGAATAQMYLANRASRRRPIGFFTWQNLRKTYPPPFRQAERMVYRQSAFAFSGSTSAEQVLRDKGYDGPCEHLPGHINPELYRSRGDNESVRSRLSLDSDAMLIGFAGRITKAKGLATLLRALGRIRSLPWELVVLGTGDYEDDFDALSQQLGLASRVHRLGYVPHEDTPGYLAAFDLVVLPSETQANWKEQFGRILIESMACGTPVIGSDSGEVPHVIEGTGGGITFPEGDAGALAGCLERLMADPVLRERLAGAGQSHVQREFRDSTLAERFATAIESAVSRATPDFA